MLLALVPLIALAFVGGKAVVGVSVVALEVIGLIVGTAVSHRSPVYQRGQRQENDPLMLSQVPLC